MEMCIKKFYLYHKEQYLILIIKKLAIINEFFLHKDICSFVTSKTFFTENSFFLFLILKKILYPIYLKKIT